MSDLNETHLNSSEETPDSPRPEAEGAPRWVWLAVIVLAAVSVLGLAVGWNATTQAKRAEQAISTDGNRSLYPSP